MKIKLPIRKLIFGTVVTLLFMAVLAALVNLHFKTAGVPGFIRRQFEEKLAEKGVEITISSLKIGLTSGFEAENIIVWDGRARENMLAEIRNLRVKGPVRPLLKGDMSDQNFSLKGAKLYFPADLSEKDHGDSSDVDKPDGRNRTKAGLLPLVKEVNCAGEISSESLELQHFSAVTAVGRIRGRGKVVEIDKLRRSMFSSEDPLDWQVMLESMSKQERDCFLRYYAAAADKTIEQDDIIVTTVFHLNPLDAKQSYAKGAVRAKDQGLANIPSRMFRGRYSLTANAFKLENIKCRFGSGSFAEGDAVYDFNKAEFYARLRGRVNPFLPFRLLKRPVPALLTEMRFLEKPEFTVEISSPTFKPEDFDIKGDIKGRNLFLYRQKIRRAGLTFEKRNNETSLRNIDLQFSGGRKEAVRGDLEIKHEGKTPRFSGRLEGSLLPTTVERLLPQSVDLPQDFLTPLRFKDAPPVFHVRVKDSVLEPRSWQGEAEVKARDFSYRNYEIESLDSFFRFEEGTVSLAEPLRIAPAGNDERQQRLTVETMRFEPFEEKLTAEGQFLAEPIEICRMFDLSPEHNLRKLTLRGAPLEVRFTADNEGFSQDDWRFFFDIQGQDLTYSGTDFESLSAKGEVDLPRITLQGLKMVVDEEQFINISDLEHDRRRSKTVLTGEAVAEPSLFEIFISDPSNREQYRNVWEDVEWRGEAPVITVSKLQYEGSRMGNWKLRMNSTVAGEDFRYKDLDVEDIRFDVTADLPGTVVMDSLQAEHGDEFMKGEAEVSLTGSPFLRFDLNGEFDVFEFIKGIRPQNAGEVKHLDAENDTKTSFTGTIGLKDPSSKHLECEVSGNILKYRNLIFKDYTASWRKVDHEVKWELTESSLAGGEVEISGYTNSFFNRGGVEIKGQEIELAKLISQLNHKKIKYNLGDLSIDTQFDLRTPSEDGSMALNGNGIVKIRKGNLWEAPILAGLGEALGMGRLGRISKFDAPIEFKGDHIQIKEFNTDGTILALTGNGKYYWDREDQLDFKVYGELLKSTWIIPFVLKPASWFFEAKLSGSLDDYSWSVMGPVKRMFSGD